MTSSEKAIITPICFISFNEIVAFGRNISTVKPTLKDVDVRQLLLPVGDN
jgi:hypothetical protein